MLIIFKTQKFQKECNDFKLLQRRYGPGRAELIARRLAELRAAAVLDVMRTLPKAYCHMLTGGRRAGFLSVNLDFPYRLIFRAANNPIPLKPDGGLDWTKVTEIEIIGVEDTHDKKKPKSV
jgi:proteic killer suppression protein